MDGFTIGRVKRPFLVTFIVNHIFDSTTIEKH